MTRFFLVAALLFAPAAAQACGGAAAGFASRRAARHAPAVSVQVQVAPAVSFPKPMPPANPPVIVKPSPPALSLVPAVGSSTTVTRTVTKSVTPVLTVRSTWLDPASGCTMQLLSDGTLSKVGCPARR